jgi:DNA-binding response OmpR family regulator
VDAVRNDAVILDSMLPLLNGSTVARRHASAVTGCPC